ncbi:MAG: rRNA maturation RNase YbeY [Micavibrio sp.]|nr:rRNA maturation RNase YbeY [Micavibrio sp.]|tara:strand:- start:1447 stop:1935 length:489 start_codon:yes stop_codon:yes gene_type:complete
MDINIVRNSNNKSHWKEFSDDDISSLFETFADHLKPEHDISESEVSVVLSDSKTVQDLNATYRQKDKPTNVLSFPYDALDMLPEQADEISELGDIILAYEVLVAEAEAEGKSIESHFKHLCLHGLLHLLGYDHEEDDEAEEMEALEIKILAKMNIKNPYQDA